MLWGIRFLAGIKYEVRGTEHFPADHRFIAASKHQSALETLAYHALLPYPSYILKKELLYIPLFGWNLKLIKCIPIDRSSGTKAMRSILDGTQELLNEGRPVVIFPEGTRTKPGTTTKYNPGVGLLYEKCGVPIIPVAVNTGYFWPKKAFLKHPGKVIFQFLPPMPEGLGKREFIDELQGRIEAACREIDKELSH